MTVVEFLSLFLGMSLLNLNIDSQKLTYIREEKNVLNFTLYHHLCFLYHAIVVSDLV